MRAFPLVWIPGILCCALVVGSSLAEPGSASGALRIEEAGATARVYKTLAGGRTLKLYVFSPKDHSATDRRPAAVFFHGGGWVGGVPGQFGGHCGHLAKRGMVAIEVEYRLLGKKDQDPPEVCICDAKSAMRWVRAHAGELGIDASRIAAGGGSAGGHLAAATAFIGGCNDPADDTKVSAKPDALLLFNPVFNNGPPPEGWGHARCGDRYREFSPAHNVGPGAPPTIIFLGTEDKLVPVATAKKFESEMRAVGARCDLKLYEGQGHGFFNQAKGGDRFYNETLAAADAFLVSLGWLPAGR